MSELTKIGVVTKILSQENGVSKAGKDWKKQIFVIETQDQYPTINAFTLFGDKIDLISNITEGQVVEVSFNWDSREYNGKYFHNINAWKIIAQQPSEETTERSTGDIPPEPNSGDDDLPF